MRLDYVLLLLELMRRCLLMHLPGAYEEKHRRFVPFWGLLEGKGYVAPEGDVALWDGASLFQSMDPLRWHVKCYTKELLVREDGLSRETLQVGGVGMKLSQEGRGSPPGVFSQNRLSWICDMLVPTTGIEWARDLSARSIFVLTLSVKQTGLGKSARFALKLSYSKDFHFDKAVFHGLIDGGICYLDAGVLTRLAEAEVVDRDEYRRLLRLLPKGKRRLLPPRPFMDPNLGREISRGKHEKKNLKVKKWRPNEVAEAVALDEAA